MVAQSLGSGDGSLGFDCSRSQGSCRRQQPEWMRWAGTWIAILSCIRSSKFLRHNCRYQIMLMHFGIACRGEAA